MNATNKKIFIIEPNYMGKSEVWLNRMNAILQDHICGMAAYIQNEIVAEKYPVFNLNGRGPSYFERWFIRFRIKRFDSQKIMREELYEIIIKSGSDILVVHYATVADYLWTVLNRFTLPIFIYVHGYDIIWDHNDNNGFRIHAEDYTKMILNISQLHNVKFIAASNCSIQNLLSIGIDRNKIYKKAYKVDLVNIERDYTKTTLTVLFLGRFVDFKGPDIVLQAFLKACDMGFKGNLIMAGDGPLKLMCELIGKRSKYSNQIQFAGEVNQQQATVLFETADIYSMHNCKGLLSNGYEIFGVTIIEAMSFGLPVVTAGVGGPAEIIEHGVDGILVEVDNVDLHAAAFLQLFQSPALRANLGKKARSKVANKYNASREKGELFEILHISNES